MAQIPFPYSQLSTPMENTAPLVNYSVSRSPITRAALIHAVTAYDRKQSGKRGHNLNALGIYFARVDDIMADLESGADLRQAVIAGFTGAVQAACLRALHLPAANNDEWSGKGAGLYYVASNQKS